MRLLIQRVKEASVSVNSNAIGKINKGLLVFFGAHKEDTHTSIPWLAKKLVNLRIFPDDDGKMNLSIKDIDGDILIVSQFTLYGQCDKGHRPDFFETAQPKFAEELYNAFIEEVRKDIHNVATGQFAAYMEVSLINDGPATFLIERGLE